MRRLLSSAALLAVLPFCPAYAQDTADAAQATQPPESDGTIVVTGQRAQLERSIRIKREALGVVDVAASDEIGQLPDRNVAEVVERLPGVGVQYDQGEGRYVAIRGVPAELNQYTINGFEIGNPDGETRRLPLDIISGQLLNRVEIFKVKTSDQDGQGIGGLVNLVPQTAFDFRERIIAQATAQAGYQEIDERTPLRGDVSLGGRFGDVGLLVGASFSKRQFNSYGFFPDDYSPVTGVERGGLPINIKFSEYDIERERIGATGSLDWRPAGSAHQLWLRGLYSRFTEDEYRQRYRLDFAGDGQEAVDEGDVIINPDGVTGSSTATGLRQDLRLEYKEKSVLAAMAGGTSELDALTLDYGIARVHNEVIEPNQVWQFRNASSIGPIDFDFSERLFTAEPRTPIPASNIQFRSYTEQDENGDEDIWALRGDARSALGGEDSFLRFGVKYRATDKGFDAANTNYTRGSSANRFTLVDAGAAGPEVEVPVREGRTYIIPISIDADAIGGFTRGELGGPRFVLDDEDTLADQVLSDLDVEEDVLAGYGMFNLERGPLALTAGLRIERTDLRIGGFQLQNGDTVVPVTRESDYTNLLPSVIARFKPRSDMIVRAAYHRSIGRPQYSSLSPGGEVEIEDDEAFVELGNPDLKPFVSDNLDLSGEYYFGRGGFVAAAVFAKFIKDPIFRSSFTVEDGSFGGTDFERIEFTQPVNGQRGQILGIEIAFEQQLRFLPGALSGLGIGANLTLVDSELDIPDGDGGFRRTAFGEQSDLLYGAQLFYQRGPIEASIAYHHTGRALLSAGSEEFEDQYNDDLRRLDAKARFRLNSNVSLFVEGQNLTDEPTRQYQGGRRDWVIQEERYGRTFWAGTSVKL